MKRIDYFNSCLCFFLNYGGVVSRDVRNPDTDEDASPGYASRQYPPSWSVPI